MKIDAAETALAAAGSNQPSATTVPGTWLDTDTVLIESVSIGTPVPGGGEEDAPSVDISVSFNDALLSSVTRVSVSLISPTGLIAVDSSNRAHDEDVERITVELDEFDASGEWAIHEISVTRSNVTPDPNETVTHRISADEISSLTDDRFVMLEVPQSDTTAPTFSDLDLPSRSFTALSDNPFSSSSDEHVEISFDVFAEDTASGLNVIDFEFTADAGSTTVYGAEWGLFGDIDGGEMALSTLNTEASAGTYTLTRLRFSDDQGNTQMLSTADLQELGYETMVNVADRDALDDSTSPTISRFDLPTSAAITDTASTLTLAFDASDDTAVSSVSLTLRSDAGGLYQFTAPVVVAEDGEGWVATIDLGTTFPSGSYQYVSVTVNDAAFNRASASIPDGHTLVIDNPFGGDITNNRLKGDTADNIIDGRSGADTLVGGDGDDSLSLGHGDDFSWAGAGDEGDDTIIGGTGDDVIGAGAGNDLLIGGTISDVDLRDIIGTTASEVRLDGLDSLYAGDGDDTLLGGNPALGDGPDLEGFFQHISSAGGNLMFAGKGNDWSQGADSDDTMGGGAGNDTLIGEAGHDIIYGGQNDADSQTINDRIYGGEGNDSIYASGGADRVNGGADNDLIYGGSGNDTIDGGAGHDQLYSGRGDDLLMGGTGNDVFHFNPNSGSDIISDFDTSRDSLILSGYADQFPTAARLMAASTVVNGNSGQGLQIDFGDGHQLLLIGVTSILDVDVTI